MLRKSNENLSPNLQQPISMHSDTRLNDAVLSVHTCTKDVFTRTDNSQNENQQPTTNGILATRLCFRIVSECWFLYSCRFLSFPLQCLVSFSLLLFSLSSQVVVTSFLIQCDETLRAVHTYYLVYSKLGLLVSLQCLILTLKDIAHSLQVNSTFLTFHPMVQSVGLNPFSRVFKCFFSFLIFRYSYQFVVID